MRWRSSTALRAALISGVASGAPSTLWALARGNDPLEASMAAGALVAPGAAGRGKLLAAAFPAHAVLSAGWAVVLASVWPRRAQSLPASIARGAFYGVAIGAFDLGIAHASRRARFARVRALPLAPQLADHVAFGSVVGAVLGRRQTRSIASAMEARTRPGRYG